MLNRRTAIILTALLITVAALYAGGWLLLARTLEGLAADWIEAQRRAGWAVAHDGLESAGFPIWPAVTVRGLGVTAPPASGSWTWNTDALTVQASGFDFTRLTVSSTAANRFGITYGEDGLITADATRAEALLDLDNSGRLEGTALRLNGLTVTTGAGGPPLTLALMEAALALAGPAEAEVSAASLTLRADALTLPAALPPFDRTVRRIDFAADFNGTLRQGRLSDTLRAWRDEGGTLEVQKLAVDWPPLMLSGDGTVALDEAMQPIGAFSTRIEGYQDALTALETEGLVKPEQAAAAALVLSLLADRSDAGTPVLTVPLTVQNQRLSVGPLNLMEMPEVTWE